MAYIAKNHSPKIIMMIETSRAYDRGILTGIARYSHINGPWNFYQSTPFYRYRQPKHLSLSAIKALNADAIVMSEQKNTLEILDLGLPTIVIHYTKPFENSIDMFDDNEAIAKTAATHLLEREFRNFAFCGFDDQHWSGQLERLFCEEIRSAGYKTYVYKSPYANIDNAWQHEEETLAEWLRSLPRPVALMLCSDDRSQDVFEACHMAHLRIPDDIAIIGVENDELVCNLSSPPLSSIVLDTQKGGYEAASLLDKWMQGDKPESRQVTIHPVRVVTRQSTDFLALEDPHLIVALKFIRDHARQPLQVQDVVKATDLSRRTLEQRFRKTLKRSVLDEIRQAKIQWVKNLLLGTNLSIGQIARKAGYSNAQNLARTFGEIAGVTPSAYRHKYSLYK